MKKRLLYHVMIIALLGGAGSVLAGCGAMPVGQAPAGKAVGKEKIVPRSWIEDVGTGTPRNNCYYSMFHEAYICNEQ